MKQRLLLSALLSFLFFSTAKAQDYDMGIGLRFGGYENGITAKYFADDVTAYEGILGFRPGVVVLTGLYQKHAPAFDVQVLKWYFGLGAHIGGISGDRYRRYTGEDKTYSSGLLLGADAVIGLEWLIPTAPLSLGADLRPRLELGKGPFIDLEPAISIRYI